MKILVGSKNAAKLEGTKKAFLEYFKDFELDGVDVASYVNNQPLNNDIYLGARNRVDNLMVYAKENNLDVDYYVGVESGITNMLGKWVIVNIAIVVSKDEYESWGTSSGFPVPDKYAEEIVDSGLAQVMDEVFNTNDAIRTSVGGVSYLTNGVINRIELTREAVIMGLIQHLNDKWNDK